MSEVLYSKCSTERKKEYQIITSIIKEGNSKYVLKKAPNQSAVDHVEKLLKYKEYQTVYEETEVRFAPCTKERAGVVRVEYIDGQKYTDVIRTLIDEKDWEQLFDLMVNYWRLISKVKNIVPFESCSEFEAVFGKVEGSMLGDAAAGVNIDMISDNIILSEECKYVIDYEWIFDFPVPLSYVYYRSVCSSPIFQKVPPEVRERFMVIAGITLEEENAFKKMEENFQSYVSEVALSQLREDINQPAYQLDPIHPGITSNDILVQDTEGHTIFFCRTLGRDESFEFEAKNAGDYTIQFIGDINAIRMNYTAQLPETTIMLEETNAKCVVASDYYFEDAPCFKLKISAPAKVIVSFVILEENNVYHSLMIQGIQLDREARSQKGYLAKTLLKKVFNK